MAWFNFCDANHERIGRLSLVDMRDWFSAGLLDLGHRVTFSGTRVEPRAINLFWECFTPEFARKLSESGVTYGIIATEIPDGVGLNWRRTPYWDARFEAFAPVAKGASFIWTIVESPMERYSEFCPTAFVDFGFSERLIPSYINAKPSIDFCFFGLPTPYRLQAIEEIRRHAKVEWPKSFLSASGVRRLIAKSKIGISFKQSEEWPIPSMTRLGRLMMAKRGVAAEWVPILTRQGEICGVCPPSMPFHEYALSMLNSNWKANAEKVFENYRAAMPMKQIMEDVLDRTVASVSTPNVSRFDSALQRITGKTRLG